MASRKSPSSSSSSRSSGGKSRPEAVTKGAKAGNPTSEAQGERARGNSGGASSKRSSAGGEKKPSNRSR